MLLEFQFRNWTCFQDENTFSLLASRERRHGKSLASLVEQGGQKVLPLSAVFGANASGKSQFTKALDFARRFIVSPIGMDERIPVRPFQGAAQAPSSFSFLILVGKDVFRYGFELDGQRVISETLLRIRGGREELWFSRQAGENGGAHVATGSVSADRARLEGVAKGTRPNQLFLNNAAYQNVAEILPVFDWFRNTLEIVNPDAFFIPVERFFQKDTPLFHQLKRALDDLDTGIVDLDLTPVPIESVPMPTEIRSKVETELGDGRMFRIRNGKDIVLLSRENGVLRAERMVAIHRAAGKPGSFPIPMSEESDGTIRLLDLLPAFFTLGTPSSRKVYVIDELDRGLHSTLMRYLVELFLKTVSAETRSQIVFTTHDIQLMTQDIFRRDEMWVVRKSEGSGAELVCLGDFKDIRFDKDIRKSYLEGRFGGVPTLSPRLSFSPDDSINRERED